MYPAKIAALSSMLHYAAGSFLLQAVAHHSSQMAIQIGN
jgi:hypothetical protein